MRWSSSGQKILGKTDACLGTRCIESLGYLEARSIGENFIAGRRHQNRMFKLG